ncbi:NB-ARC domain-containing protein [Nocardiopsis deserti]|uniref:NB-ARC domain-containing protein n=1 Tax=Nocardiopsis deserti TaxID=2605988 RepID=UPI001239F007|nr:NB-ARC domain-containing protein [Nocardiopsis deserti]
MSAETPGPHQTRNSQRDNHGQSVQARSIHGDVNIHASPDTPAVPMQVESPTADFVNHEGPQNWVRGLLDPDAPPKVVVYQGPLGIGKTSLLAKIAYATDSYFTGGQLTFSYARGRQEDSGAALAQFLRALGVDKRALPEDPRDWHGEYRTRTRGRRLLVLVEGAWEPAQVRALVPSGRGSLVLVSRDGPELGELAIDTGARIRDLDPLNRDASLELLERRTDHSLSEEDPDAVGTLLRVCGGLPLALVLVGGQLQRGGPGSARALAARIGGARGVLRAIGDDERNLDVLFKAAYDALPAPAAALYRALGTWPGPRFDRSLVDAASVGGAEDEGTGDEGTGNGALRELITANLVEEDRDGLRFRHDLVRTHARERAEAEDGEADRRLRLTGMLDAYMVVLGFAERHARGERLRAVDLESLLEGARDPFDGTGAAREWLLRERPTLLAVVLGCADLGLHDHTWRFAELATALYLDQRFLHDWAATGEAGADAARALGHTVAEARLCSLTTRPLLDLGREDDARARSVRAVELAEDLTDDLLKGSVWEFHARFLERSDPSAAVEAFDRSVRHNEASDSPSAVRGVALAILFRGSARTAAGQAEAAVADIRDARERLLSLPEGADDRMAARARTALGLAHASAGRVREAVAELTGAVAEFRKKTKESGREDLGYYEAEAHEALADVLEGLGATGDARTHLAEAGRLLEGLGSPRAREIAARLAEGGGTGSP